MMLQQVSELRKKMDDIQKELSALILMQDTINAISKTEDQTLKVILSDQICQKFITQHPGLLWYVDEYPTVNYFGNPRHAQSMIAYVYAILSICGNYSEKLHCGYGCFIVSEKNLPKSQMQMKTLHDKGRRLNLQKRILIDVA